MIKVRNKSNRSIILNNEVLEINGSLFIDENIVDSTVISKIKELERLSIIDAFYNVNPVEITTVEPIIEEQPKSKGKKK